MLRLRTAAAAVRCGRAVTCRSLLVVPALRVRHASAAAEAAAHERAEAAKRATDAHNKKLARLEEHLKSCATRGDYPAALALLSGCRDAGVRPPPRLWSLAAVAMTKPRQHYPGALYSVTADTAMMRLLQLLREYGYPPPVRLMTTALLVFGTHAHMQGVHAAAALLTRMEVVPDTCARMLAWAYLSINQPSRAFKVLDLHRAMGVDIEPFVQWMPVIMVAFMREGARAGEAAAIVAICRSVFQYLLTTAHLPAPPAAVPEGSDEVPVPRDSSYLLRTYVHQLVDMHGRLDRQALPPLRALLMEVVTHWQVCEAVAGDAGVLRKVLTSLSQSPIMRSHIRIPPRLCYNRSLHSLTEIAWGRGPGADAAAEAVAAAAAAAAGGSDAAAAAGAGGGAPPPPPSPAPTDAVAVAAVQRGAVEQEMWRRASGLLDFLQLPALAETPRVGLSSQPPAPPQPPVEAVVDAAAAVADAAAAPPPAATGGDGAPAGDADAAPPPPSTLGAAPDSSTSSGSSGGKDDHHDGWIHPKLRAHVASVEASHAPPPLTGTWSKHLASFLSSSAREPRDIGYGEVYRRDPYFITHMQSDLSLLPGQVIARHTRMLAGAYVHARSSGVAVEPAVGYKLALALAHANSTLASLEVLCDMLRQGQHGSLDDSDVLHLLCVQAAKGAFHYAANATNAARVAANTALASADAAPAASASAAAAANPFASLDTGDLAGGPPGRDAGVSPLEEYLQRAGAASPAALFGSSARRRSTSTEAFDPFAMPSALLSSKAADLEAMPPAAAAALGPAYDEADAVRLAPKRRTPPLGPSGRNQLTHAMWRLLTSPPAGGAVLLEPSQLAAALRILWQHLAPPHLLARYMAWLPLVPFLSHHDRLYIASNTLPVDAPGRTELIYVLAARQAKHVASAQAQMTPEELAELPAYARPGGAAAIAAAASETPDAADAATATAASTTTTAAAGEEDDGAITTTAQLLAAAGEEEALDAGAAPAVGGGAGTTEPTPDAATAGAEAAGGAVSEALAAIDAIDQPLADGSATGTSDETGGAPTAAGGADAATAEAAAGDDAGGGATATSPGDANAAAVRALRRRMAAAKKIHRYLGAPPQAHDGALPLGARWPSIEETANMLGIHLPQGALPAVIVDEEPDDPMGTPPLV